MSGNRFLVLLVAAVAAIAGAAWLASQRHLERATLAGESVLRELKPQLNDVSRVRLSRGDGTRVVLLRRPDQWIVEARGYPADSGRVRKLLLDLAELRVVEEKTHDAGRYPLLGVEDPVTPGAAGTLVELDSPKPVAALIVGKPAGTRVTYVRRRGAEASFLVEPQITLDADPKSWLDRLLLEVKPERVREVSVTLPGAPVYAARRTTRQDVDFTVAPLPKGRALASPGAADPLGAALSSLALDDVRARTSSSANFRAVLTTFDGLVVEVEGLEEGARRYLRLAARFDPALRDAASSQPSADSIQQEATAIAARTRDFEFEVAAYKFDALFRPLEDLLAKTGKH